jgi:hypothetical protein
VEQTIVDSVTTCIYNSSTLANRRKTLEANRLTRGFAMSFLTARAPSGNCAAIGGVAATD